MMRVVTVRKVGSIVSRAVPTSTKSTIGKSAGISFSTHYGNDDRKELETLRAVTKEEAPFIKPPKETSEEQLLPWRGWMARLMKEKMNPKVFHGLKNYFYFWPEDPNNLNQLPYPNDQHVVSKDGKTSVTIREVSPGSQPFVDIPKQDLDDDPYDSGYFKKDTRRRYVDPEFPNPEVEQIKLDMLDRHTFTMGLNRDSQHKRRSTGGRRIALHKKRKYELGRPAANTKIGEKRIHTVRTMGGNKKYRALRLDAGNFSWSSEGVTRKTRVIDVMYCAGNAEHVRTKTLTKGVVIAIDATPFRQYYAAQYAQILGAKKGKAISPTDQAEVDKKRSKHLARKIAGRKDAAKVDSKITEQAVAGRFLAYVTSRPGQSGRVDGYILEGKELEFYQRKMKK